MRSFLLTLIALTLVGCASTPEDRPLVIKEIKPRYIEEQAFKRISEYWQGKEHTGGRVILRTDPSERSGYYFTLILSERISELPRNAVIVGEFFTAKSNDMQVHEFTIPNNVPRTKEVFFGLTGEDWPEGSTVPGAWKFSIKSAGDELLAQKQSYLWEL